MEISQTKREKFALVILGGCSKDDTDNVKADSFNGTVTAKVENSASYNSQISTVCAFYDTEISSSGQLTGRTLTNGEYAKADLLSPCPKYRPRF